MAHALCAEATGIKQENLESAESLQSCVQVCWSGGTGCPKRFPVEAVGKMLAT